MRRLICAVLSISCFGCASGPSSRDARQLADEGQKLLEAGRPRAALPLLQECATLGSNSGDIRITLGDCYLELGDYLAAHTAYSAAGRDESSWRDNNMSAGLRLDWFLEGYVPGCPAASQRMLLTKILLGMPFVEWRDLGPKAVHRSSSSPTIRLVTRLFEIQESWPGIRNRFADSPGEEARRTKATATHPSADSRGNDILGGPSVYVAPQYEANALANPPYGSMAGADMDLAARDFVSARDQYTRIIEAANLAGVAGDAFLTRHVKGMALHKRGMAFAAGGDWTSARRDFEASAKCRPRDAEVLTDLGIAVFETASAAEARPLFERALEIEPLLEEAKRGLERTAPESGK